MVKSNLKSSRSLVTFVCGLIQGAIDCFSCHPSSTSQEWTKLDPVSPSSI
jgi:hypothetical protein